MGSNNSCENSTIVRGINCKYVSTQKHFTDGASYSINTAVVRDSYGCISGEPFGRSFYSFSPGINPTPTSNVGNRYWKVEDLNNYLTLCSAPVTCHKYRITFDYRVPSAVSNFSIAFTNAPQQHSTNPTLYNNIPINLSTINSWTHVTYDFYYCDNNTGSFLVLKNPSGKIINIDNLSIEEIALDPPITVSVSSSLLNSANCSASQYTLNANVTNPRCNLTYAWTPTTGLSNATISNPVATIFANTTYSVIVTDVCSGNAATGSSSITVTPSAPTATITGDQTICSGTNSTISIALTGTSPWNITYTNGTTPVTLTGITTSPYTFSTNVNATYSVTAVSDANCSSGGVFGNVTVTTVNCVCSGTNISNTIWTNSLSLTANTLYSLNANAIVSGNNVVISNVAIAIADGKSITINSGASLTINHCHLFACNEMWQGIIVNAGGSLIINNSNSTGTTFIEDAILAADISNPNNLTVLSVTNAIFNKNYDGINISNYQSTIATDYSQFSVTNSLFTCRQLTWTGLMNWPAVSGLNTLNGTDNGKLSEHFTIGDFAQTSLKTPHFDEIANSAIILSDIGTFSGGTYYGALIDGDDGTGTINVFDNMLFGINSDNSNLKCQNNAFQYIIKQSSTDGIAINATDVNAGYSTDNRLMVTSAGITAANWFYDCTTGINSDNYNDVTVKYTDMRSTQMPTGSFGSFPAEGNIGIYIKTPNCTQIEASENLVTNIRTGIAFYADAVGTGNAQSINPVQIIHNTIQANYAGETLTGEYPLIGIIANNLILGSLPTFVGHSTYNINVSGNHLHDVHNGIGMSNWIYYMWSPTIGMGNRAVSHDNFINLRLQTYPNSSAGQVGIYHLSSIGNQIYNNNIEGFSNANSLSFGIYSNAGSIQDNELVTCNRVYNTGQGIYFVNNSTAVFEKNQMESCGNGFVLNNSQIGNQGDAINASDNEWTGTYTGSGQYTAWTENAGINTMAIDSKLFIRSGAFFDPAMVGTCYSDNPLNPNTIYGGTSLPSSSGVSILTCTTLPTARLADVNQTQSSFSSNSNISLLERMVTEDSMYYSIFPQQQFIIAKHRVYRLLSMQPNLKDSSSILMGFYNNTETENIAKLSNVENLLATGQLGDALSELNLINSANEIENNYEKYYNAYIDYKNDLFTSTDSTALRGLITGCAVRDGGIVNQARSLYSLVYSDFTPYFDDCVDTAAISLRESTPVSIKYIDNNHNLEIHPNPNSGTFTIHLNDNISNDKDVEIVISDIAGKTIISEKVILKDNNVKFNIELSNGVYLISVKGSDGYCYSPKRIIIIK